MFLLENRYEIQPVVRMERRASITVDLDAGTPITVGIHDADGVLLDELGNPIMKEEEKDVTEKVCKKENT